MGNIEKYNNVFHDCFKLNIADIHEDISSESIAQWDSISHLTLVNMIEDEFDIMFESEDVLDFKSYAKGKEILRKYNVEI